MTMTDTTPDTETTELAHTLTFPYADAFAGIASVLPHASKDDFTPAICAVQVTPEHFLTTDRYAIGRYKHGAAIHPDTDSVLIPREVAEWLGKQTAKALGLDRYTPTDTLTVTITDREISIRDRDGAVLTSRAFVAVTGNFPPVERLLNDWEPMVDAVPVALKPEFVTRFSVSATKLIDKHSAYTFELGGSKGSTKPGPVKFTIGDKFDGLLQPNLILR